MDRGLALGPRTLFLLVCGWCMASVCTCLGHETPQGRRTPASDMHSAPCCQDTQTIMCSGWLGGGYNDRVRHRVDDVLVVGRIS